MPRKTPKDVLLSSDGTSGPETPSSASFETSIERLAAIVETLEQGELPLEASLKLFEEGVLLARASQRILDHAEKRVEQLLGFDAEGNPIVENLDVTQV